LTWEGEAGGSQVQRQPGLDIKTLCQINKTKANKNKAQQQLKIVFENSVMKCNYFPNQQTFP
jgi:hypothetical protein